MKDRDEQFAPGGLIAGGAVPILLQPDEKIVRRDGSVWIRGENEWVEVGHVKFPTPGTSRCRS